MGIWKTWLIWLNWLIWLIWLDYSECADSRDHSCWVWNLTFCTVWTGRMHGQNDLVTSTPGTQTVKVTTPSQLQTLGEPTTREFGHRSSHSGFTGHFNRNGSYLGHYFPGLNSFLYGWKVAKMPPVVPLWEHWLTGYVLILAEKCDVVELWLPFCMVVDNVAALGRRCGLVEQQLPSCMALEDGGSWFAILSAQKIIFPTHKLWSSKDPSQLAVWDILGAS